MSNISPTYLAERRARDACHALSSAHLGLERARRDYVDALRDLGRDAPVTYLGKPAKLRGVVSGDGVPRVRLMTSRGERVVSAGLVTPVCPPHVCDGCGVEFDDEYPPESGVCIACEADRCGGCDRLPSEPCLCEDEGPRDYAAEIGEHPAGLPGGGML